jgi:polysaccharide transporter, PST family
VIEKILSKSSYEKSALLNFFTLGAVQGTNILTPIIVYPYLYSQLGLDKFGVVTYALNLMVFLTVITDYGYNLSVPRDISHNRHNSVAISSIVSTALATRLLLLCVVIIISIPLFFFIPKFSVDRNLYAFGLLYLVGNTINPVWLYQGIEEMKHLTWMNLISKLFSILLIHLVVKSESDYLYVLGLFGVGNISLSVISLFFAYKKWSIKFNAIKLEYVKSDLVNGFPYFISVISNATINYSTLFILGIYASNETLGKYSIAEKVLSVVWQLLSTFSQAIYPTFCRFVFDSNQSIKIFIKKVFLPFGICVCIICCLISIFSSEIVKVISGTNNSDITNILISMSFVPLIVFLNIPSTQILLISNQQKVYSNIYKALAITSPIIGVLLISKYLLAGAVLFIYLVQTIITTSLSFYAAKSYIRIATPFER